MNKATLSMTSSPSELITQLINKDPLRSQALECLRSLELPDAYLAAGFVRNLVWDHLHNKPNPTALNDVDVIYFDLAEGSPETYQDYEGALKAMMPELNWQVRNQALMHKRNGDGTYKSSLDAMAYWPEKETAVAIRKLATGELECISVFGFDSLFNLQLSHNPKRESTVFEQRVKSKGWLQHWHKLTITP